MKKKLAINFAALMLIITNFVAVPMINFPNSFLLWGEPTPPKKIIDNIKETVIQ